jgi:hypothetical protein
MSYPLTTTLNNIAKCSPCSSGFKRGLVAANKKIPDDERISYESIIDAVGLTDALWCCRVEPQHDKEWRRFAVWCARQVQHLMNDQRCIDALDVAEAHANGCATDSELAAARAAAWDAARAAAWDAAWAAARAAAWAAARDAAWDAARDAQSAAWDAARAAAWDAALAAARAAAWDAARAAAWDAAWDAARAAAWDAARDAQSAAFRQLVTTGTLPAIKK